MKDVRLCTIAARAVFDPRVSATDLRVLAALGTQNEKQGWVVVRQSDLAIQTGIARPTVNGALKRLTETGYLDCAIITQSGKGKTGNKYRVVLDIPMSTQTTLAPSDVTTANIGPRSCVVSDDIGADVVADVIPADTPMSSQLTSVEYNTDRLVLSGVKKEAAAAAARAPARETLAFRVIREVASPFLDAHQTPRLITTSVILDKLVLAGADADLDIIPTVRAVVEREQKQIGSFKYFERAVREAAAQRLAPVEPIQPGEVSHVSSSGTADPGIRRRARSPLTERYLRTVAPGEPVELGRLDSVAIE